jgi:hypothetical protein
MSNYRDQAPRAVKTAAMDYDYDYKASATPTPTSASAMGADQMRAYGKSNPPPPPPPPSSDTVDGDEALLDLAQLEELHQEAERMKALGNKHMAAQVRTQKALFLV